MMSAGVVESHDHFLLIHWTFAVSSLESVSVLKCDLMNGWKAILSNSRHDIPSYPMKFKLFGGS